MFISPRDLAFLDLSFACVLYKLLEFEEVNFPIWNTDDQEIQINIQLVKLLFPNEFF